MGRLRSDQRLRIMNVTLHPNVLRMAEAANDRPATPSDAASPVTVEFNGMRIQCNNTQQVLEVIKALLAMRENESAAVASKGPTNSTPEPAITHVFPAPPPNEPAVIRVPKSARRSVHAGVAIRGALAHRLQVGSMVDFSWI